MKSHVIKSQASRGNELVLQLPALMFLIYAIAALVAYWRGWWPFG